MNDSILDVFICCAAEGETQVGKPLADRLRSSGLSVCSDGFSLKLGDGLRQAIDVAVGVEIWRRRSQPAVFRQLRATRGIGRLGDTRGRWNERHSFGLAPRGVQRRS